ncbi:MAG: UDP-2,3-diacylglucosamine pyrophosphatase [Micavibrio sp.]|nr:UDP-2,3-diacylglucosamine pyrophosphatase [Micavibrio sp.]|tara:strand:+ start:277 stop:1140 length:864 start_codon:yes stop_codon:yes gene_type:complete
MSASQEERLDSVTEIKRLGIIAGGGELPFVLLAACESLGIEPFIIAFEGHTNSSLCEGYAHIWTRLGAVDKILKTLRAHDIEDIVMIGSIRRPSMKELRPDLKAAAFFAKYGAKALGDDGLLSALKSFLGDEGVSVHGVHKFSSNLLTPAGSVGAIEPQDEDVLNIRRGIEILQGMGQLDVGQSVIVQEGLVLGVEAIEGTDALIERCYNLHREGRGGVLIKLCKPAQDQDLDLPTLGPNTVELAARYGLSGIAVHQEHSLLLKREEVAEIANKHKLFVIGINPSTY